MPTIDPDSPRDHLDCHCGQRHELGDTDCSGYFVGWITDTCCYESQREMDVTEVCARFEEAWRAWNRTGGVLGREPDARAFAERLCTNPDSIEEAVREAESQVSPDDLLQRIIAMGRRQRARLN